MRLFSLVAGSAIAFLAAMGGAQAAAIIDNGTVQLGVDDFGQLNPFSPVGDPSPVTGTSIVGLRFLPTGNESTSHGCLCEGWGVGIGETLQSGRANNNFGGASGLSLVSFGSTATTATSVVSMGDLLITHHFAPAAETDNLYRVNVTIQNTGTTDISDLRYTRTFDWDVEPTTFNEFVTQGGTGAANVLLAINNGFVDSNPFAGRGDLGASGNFVDFGPLDHGSNFDFGFGELLAGESFSFEIFYGAAATEAAAIAALTAVQAEVFSLGQPAHDPRGLGLPDGNGNPSNTFIFGFAGVGGPPVFEVPEPASVLLFGLGLIGLALAFSRGNRRAAA